MNSRMKKSKKQGREGKVHPIKCRVPKKQLEETRRPSSMKNALITEENS